MKADIELLQSMPIFGGIRADILECLLGSCETQEVAKGEFFFREGVEGTFMFVLQEGKVAVLKGWEGHDYLLCYLSRGDCFGEMELIDLFPRSASVLAVQDCMAIRVSSTDLSRIYKKDAKQFAMIHMNMGREVSRRLRVADEQIFKSKIEADLVDGHYVFEPEG